MGGKYQAYPEYKDSGVRWIGKVPVHWNPSRLKFIAGINMGQSPSSEDCNKDGNGRPFLQGNAEFGKEYPRPQNYCEVARKVAKSGELLFSVRAPVGALNIADQTYGIGRGLCSIAVSGELHQRYLWWLIPTLRKELYTISTGSTFEAVSVEQIENVKCFIPVFAEQYQIANFLDHETAKIDTLIEKQQQLIALLREKRQAVISHAVTKGLNPDAPMKDSEVEWLGEVPEHWRLKRFKFLCESIIAGPFGSSITKDMYVNAGYKVYGQEQVIPDDFTVGDYYISETSYRDLARYRVAADDVLISCVGTFGKIAVFPNNAEKGIINPRLIKASIKKDIESEYVAKYLKSEVVFKQFQLLSRGGTMGVINIAILKEILTLRHKIKNKPPK